MYFQCTVSRDTCASLWRRDNTLFFPNSVFVNRSVSDTTFKKIGGSIRRMLANGHECLLYNTKNPLQ
jgi:hypothetical protein